MVFLNSTTFHDQGFACDPALYSLVFDRSYAAGTRQVSEWRATLIQLQSDVNERPLKQDLDDVSLLMDRRLKLFGRRLTRLSRQLDRASGVGDDGSLGAAADEAAAAAADAAVMKKQMIADFSCLSCDKKLLFARKQCVIHLTHRFKKRFLRFLFRTRFFTFLTFFFLFCQRLLFFKTLIENTI